MLLVAGVITPKQAVYGYRFPAGSEAKSNSFSKMLGIHIYKLSKMKAELHSE